MPKTDVRHHEQWELTIRPDEGEKWDDVQIPYRKYETMMRVETVRVTLTRGGRGPFIQVHGRQVLKDGKLGARQLTVGYRYEGAAAWLTELAEAERRRADLGPGQTGVDW
jgi:hypothetical protein